MTLSDRDVYDLLQYMNKLDNNPNFLQEELDAYANERISNRYISNYDIVYYDDID